MSLSWNVAQKNYTTDVTPKTSVANPIHVYARFDIETEGFEIYSGNYSIEADLVSYEGRESPWYPCLVMCISRNGQGFIGCYFSPGFGEFENISVVKDGVHSSTFSDVGITIGDQNNMSVTVFDTNLPIVFRYDSYPYMVESTKFEDWINYDVPGTMPDVVLSNVYNLREIVPEDFTEYWTKVTKGNYTISQTGKELNGVNSYAWETIRVRSTDTGKLAWAVSSDGKTVTLVRTKTVLSDVWSDSRGNHWEDAVTPHFTTLPYEWDGVTFGTYDIATSFKYGIDTNIPIFDNRDIQGYIDGDKTEEDSIGYPGNKTGEREDTTDFPEVTMELNSVSSLILTNADGLQRLNAHIFDYINFLNDVHNTYDEISGYMKIEMEKDTYMDMIQQSMIKKPMEMFNSAMYFPFDVTNITTSQTISKIHQGFRLVNLDSGTYKNILTCNGFINLGSVTVTRSWFDYRDLTNMRCQLYLPYVGYVTLNLNEIIGKSVNVRYYVDLYCGGCVAIVTANNRMVTYKQGIIGVNLAITPESTSGLLSSVVGLIGSLSTENYVGAIGSGLSAVNSALSTSTGSCPANGLGLHLPQYAFFVFESDNINETSNEILLDGKPSDVSGSVGSFSGYLKVKSVDLHCGRATEKEKQKIKSLLYSGIYI